MPGHGVSEDNTQNGRGSGPHGVVQDCIRIEPGIALQEALKGAAEEIVEAQCAEHDAGRPSRIEAIRRGRRSVEGRRGTKHAGKKPCCQSGPPVLAARFYAGRRMPDREENKDKAHAYSERPVGESLENPQAGDRARHRAGKKRQDGFQAAGPHIQAYYGDHHERQGKAA